MIVHGIIEKIIEDASNRAVEKTLARIKEKYYLVEKGNDLKSELKDREIHIEKIIDYICELKGIERGRLLTKRKIRIYTECRMLVYYMIKKLYPMVSYAKIGAYFNRDHASVMQQFRLMDGFLSIDKVFKSQVDDLMNKFKNEIENETA